MTTTRKFPSLEGASRWRHIGPPNVVFLHRRRGNGGQDNGVLLNAAAGRRVRVVAAVLQTRDLLRPHQLGPERKKGGFVLGSN